MSKYVVIKKKREKGNHAFEAYRNMIFENRMPSAVKQEPCDGRAMRSDQKEQPRVQKTRHIHLETASMETPDHKRSSAVGIEDIEQTATSYESGGANTLTIRLTDGTTREFVVHNGASGGGGGRGKKGEKGDPGVTPEEVQEIVDNELSNLRGENNTTEGYAYRITHFRINETNGTKAGVTFAISTDSDLPAVGNPLTDNDVVSVVLDQNKDRLGHATGIYDSTAILGCKELTVDSYWIDDKYVGCSVNEWHAVDENDNASGNYIYFPLRPEFGDILISNNAFALGSNNKATRQEAFVSGLQNSAEGKYAASFGRLNVSGYAALTSGRGNKALGNCSSSNGTNNNALGNYSHTGGSNNVAAGLNSLAMGNSTEALGENSETGGRDTKASGLNSLAKGRDTKALGENATAFGRNTEASGKESLAAGFSTKATAHATFAVGNTTTASGDQSAAFGWKTVAGGARAYAGGEASTASGLRAFVHGSSLIAARENQAAFGQYNDNKEDTLFEIGNGKASKRSNAFEVTKAGTGKLGGNTIPTVSSGQEALLYIGDTQPAATPGKITVWINFSGAVKIIQ